MGELPTGTVTFLFTDIEGSTRLLDALGPQAYGEALADHQRIIRAAVFDHGGVEVDTQGDAFFCVFASARNGVAAIAEIQQRLTGPIRIRAGLHSGEALLQEGRYIGTDVHRAARVAATGHGSQTVLTAATAGLLEPGAAELRYLGEHRLKDLTAPVRLYQLGSHDFPPLRSLHRTNLPVAAWPLLGRGRELEEIRALVADSARLVTLTGPGGSGKTRLALQAAAELTDEFPDGVFFVALAPLRDLTAVRGAAADAVGLQPDDDLAGWLASRRLLLVLDNLEHLPGVDAVVAQLLIGETVVVATSRAPLRLAAEHELPIDPLDDQAAVELFVSRAAAAGRQVHPDQTVAEVCRRLDNLPLALELAAARAKLLSPSALLQRLEAALPLLTGGAGDRPERQRTLRATIEWSHDLLDPEAQAAFRRLSVFRGSFTLDAAEAIAEADLDRLAVLLDQSLLKPLGDDRFFLLETLREFAQERLDEAGETNEYALRHARWYLERLEQDEQAMWGPRRAELLAWFADEEDNLRALLDRLTTDAIVDAARAAHLLYRYWLSRGAWAEARQRLHGLIVREDLPNEPRARLLLCLAELEVNVGAMEAAEHASYEAIKLVKPGSEAHAYALRSLGIAAAQRGRPDDAAQFGRQLLEVAESLSGRTRIEMRGEAAAIFGEIGHTEEARALTREVMDECRRVGYAWHEAVCVANLAQFDLHEGSYEAARAGFASALETVRGLDAFSSEIEFLPYLGLALIGLDQRSDARASYLNLLDLSTRDGIVTGSRLFDALTGIALAAEPESASKAGRLHGAAASLRRTAGLPPSPKTAELERRFEQRLIGALGKQAWEEEQAVGANLTQEQAIELARSLASAT